MSEVTSIPPARGLQSTELIETPAGVFRCFRGDLICDQLRRYQAHQRNEMAMLRRLIKRGNRVIDVGAHIGATAIPFARMVGSEGQVHAFEGVPEVFDLLAENVALNNLGGVVSTELAIVTDRPGSFVTESFDHNSGKTCFRRKRVGGGTNEVGISLDEWWHRISDGLGAAARIDLIKIDVEGMEYEVLTGARQIIRKYRPALHVEVVPDHLVRSGASVALLDGYLRELGYQFFVVLGARNSTRAAFRVGRLRRLRHGGSHFDLLAVSSSSDQYPRLHRESITPSRLRVEKLRSKLHRLLRLRTAQR